MKKVIKPKTNNKKLVIGKYIINFLLLNLY